MHWGPPCGKNSTAKVPNHGSSNQFIGPPMEKLRKAEGSVYPMSLDTCMAFSPAAWRSRKGHSGPWRRGMAQGSTGAITYQVGLERTEQAYVSETWWLGVGQKGTSSAWSTSPKLPWRRSPVISLSEMGWREPISLPLIVPLNEEMVELVSYHKLFHDLDYLPVTFFGSASPQLQAYSSGGNWQSCVLLSQGQWPCKANHSTPWPRQDGLSRTVHMIWGVSFREHPWTLMSSIFSFLIGEAFRI